jgi:acetyl esterase/lipase
MIKQASLSFIAIFMVTVSFSAHAQDRTIKIWPDLAPGSERLENNEVWTERKSVANVYQPDLTVFLPAHKKGLTPAIIVFPGGGYRQVVMEKEGYKVAHWLNRNGIAAFVLKYRLDPGNALRDAQRAVSLIRTEAKQYNVDPHRIGVMGFSAGAHLAANLAMNHQKRPGHDVVDAASSRPDFMIGIYGTYSRVKIQDDTPPIFLAHAGDDSRVSAEDSVTFYLALRSKAIPSELHVYEQGEHGFALETDRGPAVTSTVVSWSARCLEWLKVRGVL